MGDENQVLVRPQRKKRKFDISSPFGILIGFVIVIAAIMLGGGGINAFKNFLDVSSILIVIGGTTATIVVAYRFGEIKHTKISSAGQGIGSHYYFLYSRSEERVVYALGFRIRKKN